MLKIQLVLKMFLLEQNVLCNRTKKNTYENKDLSDDEYSEYSEDNENDSEYNKSNDSQNSDSEEDSDCEEEMDTDTYSDSSESSSGSYTVSTNLSKKIDTHTKILKCLYVISMTNLFITIANMLS